MVILCQSCLLTFDQGYPIFGVGCPQDYRQIFTSLQRCFAEHQKVGITCLLWLWEDMNLQTLLEKCSKISGTNSKIRDLCSAEEGGAEHQTGTCTVSILCEQRHDRSSNVTMSDRNIFGDFWHFTMMTLHDIWWYLVTLDDIYDHFSWQNHVGNHDIS